MSYTTIVIPCYNEAKRLNVAAFEHFCAADGDTRLLFVDDGSADETQRVLAEVCDRSRGRAEWFALDRNRGKAEAVRQGILLAMERRAKYVGFWDADLATPLDEIDDFREVLDSRPEREMVFGSRVNLLGRNVRRALMRHYVGRIFATLAAAVLRLPIYDTQCGAKLFRVNDDVRNLFTEPFLSRWIFDVEVLARLIRQRRGTAKPQAIDVVYELPLKSWHDVHGSKLHLRDVFIVWGDLLRIRRRYLAR
jgi:glycosyltransferase involved in cell wall biosynthesis